MTGIRPGQVVDGLLDTVVRSGRLLIGADLLLVAAGPPGDVIVRAADGEGDRPVPSSRVVERDPVPDGVLTPVQLIAGAGTAWTLAPAGAGEPGEYAISRRPERGARVLLVAGTARRPADAAMAHLLDVAADLVVAERTMVLATIRASLHEREEERRRWGRELHDETLQQLGALQILLTSALPTARAGSDRPGLVESVQLATELVAGQIRNLRQLISDLRPAALDDLGLVPPLQALARRSEELSGIPVTLHVSLRYAEGTVHTRLLPDVELAIYRVVQEALTNVRRHAAATRVAVTVVEDDQQVVVEVSDDGHGFQPTGDRPDVAAGFGLEGMRERAELAGGTLEVGPAQRDGRGTTVRLRVPAAHRRAS